MWRKLCVWQCNSAITVPCATFSYCPLDEAEWSTVWKRLDMADIALCSEPPPALSLKVDKNPLLLAKPFWFSLFAMAANRMRFGFGSWNISCQIENKLRWESFWPISMDWTCSNHTRPCRLWINCRDEIKKFVRVRTLEKSSKTKCSNYLTSALLWGCYHSFHWPFRGCTGNWGNICRIRRHTRDLYILRREELRVRDFLNS